MDDVSNPVPPRRSAPLPETYLPPEDFSFVELALVFVRRKWLVFGVLALCWLLAAQRVASTPAQFESRCVLKIGRSRVSADHVSSDARTTRKKEEQDMLLEPVEVLAQRVREEYAPGSPLATEYGAYLSGTSFDKDADELLVMTARAGSAAEAEQFLSAVAAEVIDRHANLFAPRRQVLDERIAALQSRMSALDGELAALAASQDSTAAADPSQAVLQKVARSALLEQRHALEQEEVRLKLEVLDLQVQPTQLITKPQANPQPVAPSPIFTGIVSTVVGLFLGGVAALAWEFLSRVRERLRTTAPRPTVADR